MKPRGYVNLGLQEMGDGSDHQEQCGALYCLGHEMSSGIHAQPPPRVWASWSSWQFFPGSPPACQVNWPLAPGERYSFWVSYFSGLLDSLLLSFPFDFFFSERLNIFTHFKSPKALRPGCAEVLSSLIGVLCMNIKVKTVTTVRWPSFLPHFR